MERAAVGRAVAEKDHAHLVGLAQLDGQAGPHHDGKAAAHNAVGAENAPGKIRNVHGAALALAVSGFPAEQLGKHVPGISAFGQYMRVTAVGRDDIIIRPQGQQLPAVEASWPMDRWINPGISFC